MNVLTVAAFCLLAVSVSCRCAPDTCNLVDCMYPSACNGRVDPHGGYCGCCPVCVQRLDEGDRCDVKLFAGTTLNAECGTGLQCVSGQCRHMKRSAVTGPCATKLEAYNSNQHLLGATKPRCNPDGSYQATQCSGSGCHCVDKQGNNLGHFVNFGEDVEKQNCQCAVEKSEYMKSGLIGMLFYCDSMGNYAAQHN